MLALSTSLTAAADRRPADAEAALDYAADLAGRTGEGNRFSLSFGPTNVTLWRMTAALEARDYERTVVLAETVIPERIRASSRRAGYWMNYGRSLARVRRRDKAVLACVEPRRSHRTRCSAIRSSGRCSPTCSRTLVGTRWAESCGGWPIALVCRCSRQSGNRCSGATTRCRRPFILVNRDQLHQ